MMTKKTWLPLAVAVSLYVPAYPSDSGKSVDLDDTLSQVESLVHTGKALSEVRSADDAANAVRTRITEGIRD